MTAERTKDRGRAIAMLVLSTLFWGVSFPVIKTVAALSAGYAPGAGPLYVAAMASAPRYLLAALVLGALAFFRSERPTRGEWIQGLWIGLVTTLGTYFQTDGMQFTSASTSAFLTQMTAVFVPVWVAASTRRSPGWLTWGCCALVLVGVAILGGFDLKALRFGRGEMETILCAAFFAAQIILVDRKRFCANRPGVVTLIMFAVQGVVLSGLAAGLAPDAHALLRPWASPTWLLLTLVLTFVCSIGAFSLMIRWQPKISPTEAGLIYCIEPIFASVIALFLPGILSIWTGIAYPNEQASATLLVGGGLITLANIAIQFQHRDS